MPRVIVLDKLAQEGLDLLTAAEGVQFDVKIGLKGDELREALSQYDAAICRSGVKITAEVLAGNRRLRAIARAGVGTDNIDKQAATRLGIVVMNTPTGNTLSTAEHAFTLMLALSRNVAPAYQSLIEGRWERDKYMGSQIAGKTLGVIGLGRIGQEVASRAIAFGMRVIGYDPFVSTEKAAELGIELVSVVKAMLPRVDYLTVHTPLTPETKGLVSMAELEILKPGVRLINCARGGIYDEAALAEGLKAGKIGGVALDVFAVEPCKQSPLYGMPNVLCTPHLGASTEEAQTQVAIEAVELILNYLKAGEVRHAVNMSSIDPKTLQSLRGYLDVAYRLGLFLSQAHTGAVTSCQLNYRGEIAQKDTKLLSAAFCAGLLERALDEEANIVNSELLLKERGIKLTEQKQTEMGAFSSSITATVSGEKGSYTAGGTLFGNNMPRLFRLQEHRLEAYMDGSLLIFTHNDVPGIIGQVGTLFGKHKVNIAQMAVGRSKPGGEAIGVLNLDALPPAAALEEARAIKDITSALVIEMPAAGEMPPWLEG